MSLAFRKNAFRIEIRRQHFAKILHAKRLQSYAFVEVNDALLQYMSSQQHSNIPKILITHYELIDEEHIHAFLKHLCSVKFDVAKSTHLALLNKVFFANKRLSNPFFCQISKFAEKVVFTLSGQNQSQPGSKNLQKSCIKPPPHLKDDLILLPNCFIEYWGNYFSTIDQDYFSSIEELDQQPKLQMEVSASVMRCFIRWFSPSKGKKTLTFSKFSVCYFLKHFLQSQNIFFSRTQRGQEQSYRQFEALYHEFRTTAAFVVFRLIEEQFFCSELINLLRVINNAGNLSNCLFTELISNDLEENFFLRLLDGLSNESIVINSEIPLSQRFFYSGQQNEEIFSKIQQISIENTLKEDISMTLWKCKIKMLDVFNTFLTQDNFWQVFEKSQVETILDRLLNFYACLIDHGKITTRIQKSICIILYNILLLAEEDDSEDYISCLIIRPQNYIELGERLRKYFSQNNGHILKIIQKNQFSTYDQIVELISLIEGYSYFMCSKETDETIMNEGRLVMRICDAFERENFDEEETKKIAVKLVEYLEKLYNNQFDFSTSFEDIQRLSMPKFQAALDNEQDMVLRKILNALEPSYSFD